MSGRDVYGDEMPTRALSDRQIEIILGGQEDPEEETLARFRQVLTALHPVPSPPTVDAIVEFAAQAAGNPLATREERTDRDLAKRLSGPGFTLKRRLAGSLAAAVLLAGMTGVAVAANGAGPGDALYGLDRALEAVGIGNGGAEERLTEAREVLERGDASSAIEHVADALEVGGTHEEPFSPEAAKASAALRGAAESVRGRGLNAGSENVREDVAAMLSEIAAMLESETFDGSALGEEISEMARALEGNSSTDPGPGRPQDVGPDSPGQSGDAGPERARSGENRGAPPSDAPGGPPDRP